MRISELADATQETPRTIRFYETSGLLAAPPRTPNGYRNYDRLAIGQIRFIRALQRAGLSLADIATLVQPRNSDERSSSVDRATLLASAKLKVEDSLVAHKRTRQRLAALANTGDHATPTRQRGRRDR